MIQVKNQRRYIEVTAKVMKLYSYKTMIGFIYDGNAYFTKEKFSVTTSRHLNAFVRELTYNNIFFVEQRDLIRDCEELELASNKI